MFQSIRQDPLYLPQDPTRLPLTPRTPNACTRYSALMTSQTKASQRTSPEERRRSSRSSQLPRKPDQARDLRRQIYLSKVREASDNKRWENRSDTILREEFLARQREWELEQATSAPEEPLSPEEEPESADAAMVDQILSREDQEFQALISSMNETEKQTHHQKSTFPEHTVSDYGSDEEEYDRLFMDVISHPQQSMNSEGAPCNDASTVTQDMDMSTG